MSDIKFTDVQKAKANYNFKNTKGKLCRTNAATWYNKIFTTEQPFPILIRSNKMEHYEGIYLL